MVGRKARLVVIGMALSITALGAAHRIGQQQDRAALLRADPEHILRDQTLRETAIGLGATAFRAHCAGCHGADGHGDHGGGTPDLGDREHLYGQGRVAEIEQIIRYGIRSDDRRGWNLASMPAYAEPRPYAGEPLPSLSPAEIADLADYLLTLGHRAGNAAAAGRGAALYGNRAGCWDCHGRDAKGDPAIGAPDLTDTVWLYGKGDAATIQRSIAQGRGGFSPAFAGVLTAAEIRATAAYVATLEPGR